LAYVILAINAILATQYVKNERESLAGEGSYNRLSGVVRFGAIFDNASAGLAPV
jgi:hypothetical protein